MDGMKQYYDIIPECTRILTTRFAESEGVALGGFTFREARESRMRRSAWHPQTPVAAAHIGHHVRLCVSVIFVMS